MKELDFKAIKLEDKEKIKPMLRKYSSFCLSAFSLASLVSWEMVYHYKWTIIGDTLLMHFQTLEDGRDHLLQPVGEFPPVLQDRVLKHASTLNYQFKIFGVSETFIKRFPSFVSQFEITKYRDMDNYIYSSEDLALLKGKDYQAKRNLIHQFEKNYSWKAEQIATENIEDCFDVLHKIYDKKAIDADHYLAYELQVLQFVLKHFVELEQHGILIRVNGKPVAFSIFEFLNPTTCVIHFEKAMREYKGLYQLINREAAKFIFERGYPNINREEDLGIEGLRKAKLSYHPQSLCPAFALIYQR